VDKKPIEFFYENASTPRDEDERCLAIELKKYHDNYGLLPSEIEENEMKALFERAGLTWVDISEDKNFFTL
jgi:hypothetical protein